MPERICILHIGTHKTGTTSLQAMFAHNRQALADAGAYFPPVGMTEERAGQHKIAWDLMAGDFNGHVKDLTVALGVSPLPVAIVSSEDLSLLHPDANTFDKLVRTIERCGYQTKVVVYLRAQAPYAESMYAERIKHEDIKPVREYVDEILRTGTFHPRASIPVAFEYSKFLDRISLAIGDDNIAVRPYPCAGGDSGIYADFLTAVHSLAPQFDPHGVRLRVAARRMNDTLTFFGLLEGAYVALNPESNLADDPLAFLARYAPEVPLAEVAERFAIFTREEYVGIGERFSADNETIRSRFGVDIPFAGGNDIAPRNDARWERVAIERNAFDRCLGEWLRKTA